MIKKTLLFVFSLILLCGCASVVDAPRNILGFSRKSLEKERESSSYQVYQSDRKDIFMAILEACGNAKYTVFTKDEISGFIAVMDIPGAVNTTEVGVFLTELPGGRGVKVELSSRSTPAKRSVAAVLFSKLAEKFNKA